MIALEHLGDVRGADCVNLRPSGRVLPNASIKLPIGSDRPDRCESRNTLGEGEPGRVFARRLNGRRGKRLLFRHPGNDRDDVDGVLSDCYIRAKLTHKDVFVPNRDSGNSALVILDQGRREQYSLARR